MNDVEQRVAAKAFAAYWKDKGYEKGESQSFWLSLLRDVFGKEHPEQFILFEEQVHLDHTSFIDGNIPETKVLIEQKGLGKDLRKPIKQSDGTYLTPFQQAKRYITELPLSQHRVGSLPVILKSSLYTIWNAPAESRKKSCLKISKKNIIGFNF